MIKRKFETMDGNTAASHVSYAFTDVAAIYPISPSSMMAENTDRWSTEGKKNIFDQKVEVVEMQSEGGAAGAIHGSLVGGALTTTFTCSQGLLLMIPNMYKMAGELLPAVINVSARAIATHALSIFGDHSDIYASRQTGFCMVASTNAQEAMDLGAVVHLSAIKGSLPFIHFFDGYRTSDELRKIQIWDTEDLKTFADYDCIEDFRNRAMNPNTPNERGTAQNPDVFFQAREAINPYYENIVNVVEDKMNFINEKIGTDYKLFNYYGAADADHIIVAMGSVCDTIVETIEFLASKGEKIGLVKVRLFRPFSVKHFLASMPKSVKTISVLDRGKEPGGVGEPLFMDVVTSIKDTEFKDVKVLNGRYGLASKNTTPSHIASVYRNKEKTPFTVGINDDVTYLSLPLPTQDEIINTTPAGTKCCTFWGLGADGTVGANKNSIKIIGDNTELYTQAYFSYDSKKSGGLTVSHLRFGSEKITSTYLVDQADFVACHNPSYVKKYDITMISSIKPNGTFLINSSWSEDEFSEKLSIPAKKYLYDNNISVYTIDGVGIAKEIGLGNRINTILQSAFFKLAGIIPIEDAVKFMKDAATKTYSKKGEEIVKMNHLAIDQGCERVVKLNIPSDWNEGVKKEIKTLIKCSNDSLSKYVNNLLVPINKECGNDLPVSKFSDYVTGAYPSGSSAHERRGIASEVPSWDPDNCIQCNFCSYVCPHGVIRPVVMTKEEVDKAPKDMKVIPMNGMPDMFFAITVSTLDCTGCGSCINVCPGKKGNKALGLEPIDSQLPKQEHFDYGKAIHPKEEVLAKFKPTTVKGSQFKQPLLEFSGACAGCGETPYAKLVTQLYGDSMCIANATGCSSIWGGSSPSTPYTTNHKGEGPAWANSLFEDNAEFGFGINLAQKAIRNQIIDHIDAISTESPEISSAVKAYKDSLDDTITNKSATEKLVSLVEGSTSKHAEFILKYKKFVSKKSTWIFGGDGWAYDIGFGGLDHVIASGENINILVFDTEIYSNTGGQASKSTPFGAAAKFASSGKAIKKKDLAQIAMTYGYVYVAQISQGADYNQTLKAITEAENYNGPSLIIAYSPCISHGISIGMDKAQTQEKFAVETGYWNIFRYDPRLIIEGKNPLQIDSKDPSRDLKDFLVGEIRYNSILKKFPDRAEGIVIQAKKYAKDKWNHLKKMSQMDYSDSKED